MSEIKDNEEEKYYHQNKNNSSVEIDQKQSQLIKAKSNSIYKTQERIPKIDNSSFFWSDNEEIDFMGKQNTLKKKQWKIKYSLKCHLDAVRSLYFNMNMNIMASASEDRTIRLWKADSICNKEVDEELINQQQVFSYMTLRGHTGALFAMSGPSDLNQNSHKKILYSAGEEGVIRVWKIPSPVYYDSIESTHENQHWIGVWEHHSDAIWDLQHHPTENWILSLSADNEVALWMTIGVDEKVDGANATSKIRHVFKNKELFSKYYDTPTSWWWIGEDTTDFIWGYVSPNIIIFDANTGTKKGIIKFQTQDFKSMKQQQPNRIIYNNSINLVISGHEDKEIKLFDINSNKWIKSFVGHTDSVSALANANNGYYLISGGHDGALRCWDIRKQQWLYDIPAHRKKYDEGVHFIASHPIENMVASCGADSNIKIFVAPHLGATDNEFDNSYQNSLSIKNNGL